MVLPDLQEALVLYNHAQLERISHYRIVTRTGGVKADIIAMSTNGRSGVGRWVFGSVAEKVLRGGDTPVILVRAPVDDAK